MCIPTPSNSLMKQSIINYIQQSTRPLILSAHSHAHAHQKLSNNWRKQLSNYLYDHIISLHMYHDTVCIFIHSCISMLSCFSWKKLLSNQSSACSRVKTHTTMQRFTCNKYAKITLPWCVYVMCGMYIRMPCVCVCLWQLGVFV